MADQQHGSSQAQPSANSSQSRVNHTISSIRNHAGQTAGVFLSTTAVAVAGVYISVSDAGAADNKSSVKASQQPIEKTDNVPKQETQVESVQSVSSESSAGGTTTTLNSGTNASGQTDTTLTVNGQDIPVPDNGSTHQTINTGNGHISIQVSGNNSSSSTNVHTNPSTFNHTHSTTMTTGGGSVRQ